VYTRRRGCGVSGEREFVVIAAAYRKRNRRTNLTSDLLTIRIMINPCGTRGQSLGPSLSVGRGCTDLIAVTDKYHVR
jgi:hypothetical protein